MIAPDPALNELLYRMMEEAKALQRAHDAAIVRDAAFAGEFVDNTLLRLANRIEEGEDD